MTTTRRQLLLGSLAAAPAFAAPSVFGAGKDSGSGWELPPKQSFTVIENSWIPMPDGIRLGSRLWIPEGAEASRVPVVFEYIPYRKRDAYRPRDDAWGAQLAQYGIAYARVDVRGSGDSDGVIVDEYSVHELTDGVSIIAWLARQPWSNGSVGMRGISWGGINTLQVAAMAPPELKAIMPMGCCDIRYTDDAHYIGGALGQTNFQWGVQFKSVMAGPPDPEISGPDWEAKWRQRLDATPAIISEWVSHQRYDAYWKRGSVAVDYASIKCPVYVVDGWIDTYSNPVGRLLEHLQVPRKGLIGAWGHSYPDSVSPGPGLQWAHEEVRWWQQWLQGKDTGIMDEPMFRAYMPYTTPWEVYPNDLPGRWIAEPVWPSAAVTAQRWHLSGDGALLSAPGKGGKAEYVADKIVGLNKTQWLPFPPSGMPAEQSEDDARSLVFNSPRLTTDIEILGYPIAKIRVAANVAVAKLVVRLTDVAPDGKSWLVGWGLLNLTHRESHENPSALKVGEFYDVSLKLNMTAHRFKHGHRIRIALSESMWPMVWPSPEIATLTFDLAASAIDLPVRRIPAKEAPFLIPQVNLKAGSMDSLLGRPPADGVHRDTDGKVMVERHSPEASFKVSGAGTTLTRGSSESSEMIEGKPNSCIWRQTSKSSFQRDGWICRLETSYEITSTPTTFKIRETLSARKGEETLLQQDTVSEIARDLI
jgi:uncharacterized protein